MLLFCLYGIASLLMPFTIKIVFFKQEKYNILSASMWAVLGLFIFAIGILIAAALSQDM